MFGARFGALTLALVLVFTGCSKPSRNLIAPAPRSPGAGLPGTASLSIPAHMDPDTAASAFGRRVNVHVVLGSFSPGSIDTTRSRVFRWRFESSWIAVDSAVTRLPSASLVLVGPADTRTPGTSLRVYAVDSVIVTHRDTTLIPGTTRDTVKITRTARLDTVATARMGIGFLRPGRTNVTSIQVVADSLARVNVQVPDVVALRFGAGIVVRAHPRTSAGIDTSDAGWVYYWDSDPSLVSVERPAPPLGDPTSRFYLLGTPEGQVRGTQVNARVVRRQWVYSYSGGKLDSALTPMDTMATGSLIVNFKRSPSRDVTADFWLYHITRALGGSISASQDSAVGRFVNNDADTSLLRAGNLTVGGTLLSERHLLNGQHYGGPFLFKMPAMFEIQSTGPDRDATSQVPQVNFSVEGPPNELAMTAPDNRAQLSRSQALELQWSGGLGRPTQQVRIQQPAISRRDTIQVPVTLQVRLTDAVGHTFLIQTLDSGRFTISTSQLASLVPGPVEALLVRQTDVPVSTISAGIRVDSTVHLIEENHSWFFLR